MKKLIPAATAIAIAVALLVNVGQAGTKKFTIALIPGAHIRCVLYNNA